jgi:redox-sensitive bicupin YhaK (pirin superfamily)
MITLRPSAERGHADHGWLNTRFTFSFADYFDPEHMGFRSLRVINEDFIAPDRGFGMHPHRDMEIITYVVEGALAHKDSMGNGAVTRPGDVQRMSAGSGVVHSEANPSTTEKVHLLQIWILPERNGIKPSYEQKTYTDEEKLNQLRLVATPGATNGAVNIHQDTKLYASRLEAGKTLQHTLARGRGAWIQLISGELEVNGKTLKAGDGAAVENESALEVAGKAALSEFLLFDLA